MFTLEVLIGVEDLSNEARMERHRTRLDGGAKAKSSGSKFASEEILPYLAYRRVGSEIVAQPETDETRAYRVLRRDYT